MEGFIVDIEDRIDIIINSDSEEEIEEALIFLYQKTINKNNSKDAQKKSKGTSFNGLLETKVLEKKSEFFSALKKLLSHSNRDLVLRAVSLFDNFGSFSTGTRIQDAIGKCGAIETLIGLLFPRDHAASNNMEPKPIVLALSNIIKNGSVKNGSAHSSFRTSCRLGSAYAE